MVAKRGNELVKLACFPDLFYARALRRLCGTVHVTRPRFRGRITTRNEKNLRRLVVTRQHDQRGPLLFQTGEVIQIVLLPELVINIVSIDPWFSAEENEGSLGSNRFGNPSTARRQFFKAILIADSWSRWCDANYRRGRHVPG